MDPFFVSMSPFPTAADLLLAVLANIGCGEQPSSRTLFMQRAACSQFQGSGTSTRRPPSDRSEPRKTQSLLPRSELSRNPPWAGATAGGTPSCSRSFRPERAQHQAELRDLPELSVIDLSFDAASCDALSATCRLTTSSRGPAATAHRSILSHGAVPPRHEPCAPAATPWDLLIFTTRPTFVRLPHQGPPTVRLHKRPAAEMLNIYSATCN